MQEIIKNAKELGMTVNETVNSISSIWNNLSQEEKINMSKEFAGENKNK